MTAASPAPLLVRYWAPAIAYCVAIYLLSAQPSWRLSFVPFAGADKVAHVLEYALLGALVLRALGPGTRWMLEPGEAVVATVLFALCFGALDEVHQSFVPGRAMDFLDLGADVAGAAMAAAAYQALLGRPNPAHA